MTAANFHVFSIVEGDGEIEAVPKLLYHIWGSESPLLRTDQKPWKLLKGKFIHDQKKRQEALNVVRSWASARCQSGVLILLDADKERAPDFVRNNKNIQDDIEGILKDVPYIFALAEKGYESWLVAGFGGGNPGNPEDWINDHKEKTGLGRKYSKTVDQSKLSAQMDIQQAYEDNCSFKRLCKKLWKWRDNLRK